jgi:hypothetical protein
MARSLLAAALLAASVAGAPQVQDLVDLTPSKGGKEVGQFQLEEVYGGPELGPVPLPRQSGGREVSLVVRKVETSSSTSRFAFSLKVANNIRFDGESTYAPALTPFFGLKVGQVISTRMLGSPEQMKVERAITDGLKDTNLKWMMQDQSLIIQSPTLDLTFRSAKDESVDSVSSGAHHSAQMGKGTSQKQPDHQEWCPDSRAQLCRKLCTRPTCSEGECAMRNGMCCDYNCVSKDH